MAIDSPCWRFNRNLELLLVIQASEGPRTGAEQDTGTFSARQARSPGFWCHTGHSTQTHLASVWRQKRGLASPRLGWLVLPAGVAIGTLPTSL